MNSAGRILIMPKGEWDAEAEYEMLDLVSHNGTSWLAKKSVKGIEPNDANYEYWHKLTNISPETIGALSTEGGTLTGNVHITCEWPTLFLSDGSTNRIAMFGKDPENNCVIYAYMDSENYNGLVLAPETAPMEEGILLRTVAGGTMGEYKIFGQHNLDLLNQHIDARIAEYLSKNP